MAETQLCEEETQLCEKIDCMRRFNRFYTKKIGLLNQGMLKTRFSLTQARVLFELAQREKTISSELIIELGIDPGYLSRILSAFEKADLVHKVKSKQDSRQRLLSLTAKGRKAFSELNSRATDEIKTLLQNLSDEHQHRLINAIHAIEQIIGDADPSSSPYLLRQHKPGDIGWMIYRHGVLYAEEYAWDETFEALVADILARFIHEHDPERERLWIAERDGEPIGSVMVVDAGEQVAQLRLLLVEPKARGKGVGKRLIDECIDFSKRKKYKKIKLWTQSILLEARHLYSKAGFTLLNEEPHRAFGHDLVAEFWERPLE